MDLNQDLPKDERKRKREYKPRLVPEAPNANFQYHSALPPNKTAYIRPPNQKPLDLNNSDINQSTALLQKPLDCIKEGTLIYYTLNMNFQ